MTPQCPTSLICPLTKRIGMNFVVLSNGVSCDLAAFHARCTAGNCTCPITGAAVTPWTHPNLLARHIVDAWLKSHPAALSEVGGSASAYLFVFR